MQAESDSVTSEDAAYLKSREARVIGQGQPPADSISAEAQRLASANEEDTKTSSRGRSQDQMDPATQSTIDRTENFQDAAEQVGSKMVRPDAPPRGLRWKQQSPLDGLRISQAD